MNLLSKTIVSVLLMFSLGTFSSVYAVGKIENSSMGDVKSAIESVIKNSEAALASLKSGGSDESIQGSIRAARQASKSVEVGKLLPIREKASSKLKKARKAVRAGQKDQAEGFLAEAIKGYQKIQAAF